MAVRHACATAADEADGFRGSWREAYVELARFVGGRGDIRIDEMGLSVPGALRGEFYGLVERVQERLAREVLGARLELARETAKRAAAMRGRLVEMSGLRAYRVAPTLERFLKDAEATLAKPAFALVLDALQRGEEPDGLEERARLELVPFCASMRRNAYEAWVYFGVVAALGPRRFWAAASVDAEDVRAMETDEVGAGFQVASPERRIPEAAFETADGRVFALKMEAARELDYYGVKIERRRDTSAGGNTEGLVAHRVLLLYRLGSVEELGVVVDRQKRWQVPNDLMVEVLEPADLSRPAHTSSFVARINAARSQRPVQAVTFDEEGAFPDGMLDDPTVAPVERRVVGFDENRLSRIAALLGE
ncbi:hypothetical protein B5F40_06025 [Gordonibacter sp. An230]|uniref:hypothetical protein n=1 Tax=Gordonibacter sp. An230 TaxID=1965592 RepID=UPI000B3AA649|nr:hypothetical protein [Gordonibacter sp. An230]OUO90744.1 hypothetical protein B5F40_06025 [Gordonibacter sp. An230]